MNLITTELENIAEAIDSCEKMAASHVSSAKSIFTVIQMLTLTLMTILFVVFVFPYLFPSAKDIYLRISDALVYLFFGIYVLSFTVLMSSYRLHIAEAARMQHSKVGFMRIRVAGSNNTEGYKTEVRIALTGGALKVQRPVTFPAMSEQR